MWPVVAGLMLKRPPENPKKLSVREFFFSILVPHLSVPISPDSVVGSHCSYIHLKLRNWSTKEAMTLSCQALSRRNRMTKKRNQTYAST